MIFLVYLQGGSLALMTVVVMVSPSRKSWTPVADIGKGQAAHMEFVEAGQEKDEGADGV